MRYMLAGGVWTQLESRIPLGCRKMLENAAESHTSGVSMKAQSDRVVVGHVFGYAPFVQRTGTRIRERGVRVQSKRA